MSERRDGEIEKRETEEEKSWKWIMLTTMVDDADDDDGMDWG